MKHQSYNWILATLMVPGLLMFSSKASASTGTIHMNGTNSFSVGVGQTVTVPLTVNVTDGDIGGFRFILTYDKSVVEIVDWDSIVLNPAFVDRDNLPNLSANTTQIAAYNPNVSLTGNVTLADVTFTARAAQAASTTITITPERLYDSQSQRFNPIEPSVSVTANVTDGGTIVDTTPDQFTIPELAGVEVSSEQISDPITVTGINQASPISVANGEYSINGAPFTAESGIVNEGDVVSVRQISSPNFLTTTVATLTIGGVSANFAVTTMANPEPVAPVLEPVSDTFNATIGTPLTFTAQASDENGDPLTFILAGNAPEGASIDSATGVFTWTPTTAGTFTFDIGVTDGTFTDTQTITVVVSEVSVEEPETPVVEPATLESDEDTCGRDCERYKEYRREYKSDENRKIYQMVKEMKKKNPERFDYLRELYLENKHLSSSEREEKLDDKTLWEFKLYKKYNGYRHYRNLKEKVD